VKVGEVSPIAAAAASATSEQERLLLLQRELQRLGRESSDLRAQWQQKMSPRAEPKALAVEEAAPAAQTPPFAPGPLPAATAPAVQPQPVSAPAVSATPVASQAAAAVTPQHAAAVTATPASGALFSPIAPTPLFARDHTPVTPLPTPPVALNAPHAGSVGRARSGSVDSEQFYDAPGSIDVTDVAAAVREDYASATYGTTGQAVAPAGRVAGVDESTPLVPTRAVPPLAKEKSSCCADCALL
jgi:hypothetical protein